MKSRALQYRKELELQGTDIEVYSFRAGQDAGEIPAHRRCILLEKEFINAGCNGGQAAMSEFWAWQGRQQVRALEPRSDWTGLGGHEGPNARASLAERASPLYSL